MRISDWSSDVCSSDLKGNCSKTNLVWDSRRQNTLDRKWVDRHKKLTTAQAAEIKRRLSEGEYGRALAREFNVSKTSIYFIKIGKHHADVMLNGAREWKIGRASCRERVCKYG